MRSLILALLLGLVSAAAAQAKLNPTFSDRIAESGDTLELDLGEGSEHLQRPVRIFLVSLEGDDRPQVKIGELGALRRLRFEVPEIPAGEYTIAIWFKPDEIGPWANALEGINSLLTIRDDERAALPPQSDGSSRSLLWALAVTIGGVGAGLVGWGWRRAVTRVAPNETSVAPTGDALLGEFREVRRKFVDRL